MTNATGFSDRLSAFIDAAYSGTRSSKVMAFAVAMQRTSSTVYAWLKGKNEPRLSDLVKMHENGANAAWLLVDEGPMFSDTPRGRQLAKNYSEGRP